LMGRPAMSVSGPLALWEAPYRSWLAAQGFTPGTIGDVMFHLDGLSGWLERERVAVSELTPERVGEFERERLAAGYCRRWARCARLPLRFLREVGAAPQIPAPARVDGPVERVLVDYRAYLARERGLAEDTIGNYERVARLFLVDCLEVRRLALEELTAADVSAFLARECPKRSVSGARSLVFMLRPLLRYLHVTGRIGAPLRWSLPAVADLRDRSLPRGLDAATVGKLLASCDRRRTVGRRDYAILLLMARLGLRAGEVAALALDDLDWRAGEIVVHGKGDRDDRLPLPIDVGEALVDYLRDRPRADSRIVFMRVLAPAGPLGHGVKSVVPTACERAGVPVVGAHRLRHTAATGMLSAGASLPEIAQVLRHRQLRSTVIYAKVDRKALRPLGLPWPGAQR
jgi:integrase/recombinase XerD